MKHLILIVFYIFSQPNFARSFSIDFLGEYQVTPSVSYNENQYLDCDSKKTVELHWLPENTLLIQGLGHPIIVRKINSGIQNYQGALLGPSQAKAVSSESDFDIEIRSFSRICPGDLTGLTCYIKPWQKTMSLTVIKKNLSDGYALEAMLEYQPFTNTEAETCEFIRFVEE